MWNKVNKNGTLVLFFRQLMLEAQNRRIDDLMERIRLQQEKLDKQNVRIRTLQSQVSKRYNQHTSISALHFIETIVMLFWGGGYFDRFSAINHSSITFFRSSNHDRDRPRGAAALTAPSREAASRSKATHQSVSEDRKRSKSPPDAVLKSTEQNLTPNVACHLVSEAIKKLKSLAIKIKESYQFGTRFPPHSLCSLASNTLMKLFS